MIRRILPLSLLSLSLAACATTAPPSPVEVSRFVAQDSIARLGSGTIFVTAEGGLETSAYSAAVARELQRLGYREGPRTSAQQIAEVQVERFVIGASGQRSPVSVGVGGSTGTFGSGVGLGLGINLGGGSQERIGTQMAVRIRDRASGASLWEARAEFDAGRNSDLADREASAQRLASALFRNFPGNNGETYQVRNEV
ncbi:DUF4136 domain-containing protein [Qipengyuania spongiae]|uniref:DUF4136 domain-containing protein n=1 Tax=Qipengyuania spongiae TaxID=2909673 RepID=A0ABY5SYL0_9SPHN|nr:DUF4136 domain-containing protein [Qipengyuania spongiae]UVI39415.1 DUF4136 domain-containing protein [Qipengyuania spongiae]